ncbi:MAG: GGDEF domain-containing protein [Gemmatimonadetes bacterium]|nr:GGDEF domain-containing protein [Gemmatimonadota bacterium]
MVEEYSPRPVPARALALSLPALAVPVVGALTFPDSLGEYGVLLWLLALVPIFLLAYYRGWRGVAAATATGMAVLSLTQVLVLVLRLPQPNWLMLLAVVIVYIGIALGVGWLSELLHRERWRAEQVSLTDPLTLLPNRRYATLVLYSEFSAAQRGRPLAIVFFDLDHFKAYNDRFGHTVGDDALRALGRVLTASTRHMNLSARYGGEEFLSVLSDCDVHGAVAFAERIRAGLRAESLRGGPLTLSAGVAVYQAMMDDTESLLRAADRALYEAKRSGRDCVRIADGTRQLEPDEHGESRTATQ